MKVLALVPNIRGFSPGQRSSIEIWERVLAPAGIHLEYAPFETARLHEVLYQPGHTWTKISEMVGAYAKRVRELRNIDDFDAVFVYREAALLGPAFLERMIARKRKPIIYQLDDPLYVPYRSPSNGYLSYLKFFGKVADIIRLSHAVIVNSTHHREYALRFNSNVFQVPSLVDTDKYVFDPNPTPSETVCVGWSGSPTTVQNLKMIEGPLRELAKRVDHKVHFIGGTDFGLEGVKYTSQQWRAETEVADLKRINVGLVPLPTNEWNKRKFNLKVAQYMALGIPPVCTPLGSNPDIVSHGVTGFLADSPKEWVDYMELLVRDSNLRSAMGVRAAQNAKEKYSLEANSETIIRAFRSTLNGKQEQH